MKLTITNFSANYLFNKGNVALLTARYKHKPVEMKWNWQRKGSYVAAANNMAMQLLAKDVTNSKPDMKWTSAVVSFGEDNVVLVKRKDFNLFMKSAKKK